MKPLLRERLRLFHVRKSLWARLPWHGGPDLRCTIFRVFVSSDANAILTLRWATFLLCFRPSMKLGPRGMRFRLSPVARRIGGWLHGLIFFDAE